MTLDEQAEAFDKKHPEVWAQFQRIAMRYIRSGVTHYSADGIMHIVRYHTMAGDSSEARDFKINNNHVAYYARKFAREYPQHSGFFRFRERRAA